ncbi:MAG: hypothetical protein HQL32_10720 [Planctomycetes bacterium]|nr:hypothetical protein [Planctomycetota bacterium]
MSERKKWSRPEIQKVPLMVEEAILASCKSFTRDSTGPGSTGPSRYRCVNGDESRCNDAAS